MRNIFSALLTACFFLIVVVAHQAAQDSGAKATYLPFVTAGGVSLSGMVEDGEGPVPGAVVRVQATTTSTRTGGDGRFTLADLDARQAVRVTAWADGYYIGGGEAHFPGAGDVAITLAPLAAEDNSQYAWLSAHAAAGQEGNCQNCHADATGKLPYDEWLLDAHGQSAHNGRFLNMYLGTDAHGNQSPPTATTCTPDYGCFPLPPDPGQPYYGPGYKLDFPTSAGSCAACHAPAAAANNPLGVDPSAVSGVGGEGVACDFCHKIWDVKVDPATGLPADNMPGVMSYELRRPPEGHQFFAGPFDDVAPGEDTFSALQKQSLYCAPCHTAVFWDTRVYNSYGEWLASPYSDPQSGQSCQECHMPPAGTPFFARADKGGLARDPDAIAGHRMPGAADVSLLQSALTMTVEAERKNGQVHVAVMLTNDGTGHHVPTDSPLRQLLLLVEARDAYSALLAQDSGPQVPDWGGSGDPDAGHYAGLPGKGYAKILKELWTDVSPTGAYWNQTVLVSDNRIPARGSDRSEYAFRDGPSGPVEVTVRLLFRRAFITLAEQKSWPAADITMEEATLQLP